MSLRFPCVNEGGSGASPQSICENLVHVQCFWMILSQWWLIWRLMSFWVMSFIIIASFIRK